MMALLMIFWFSQQVVAQVPGVSTESMQLQQLIHQSEEQLKALKEILSNSKQDTKSLEKASQILDQLSQGIDRSIEQFQGTPAYEKALLQIQSDRLAEEKKKNDLSKNKDFQKYQNDSWQANQSDLDQQQKIETALRSAEPAFVPKLQTQAQIGSWRTATRVSSQLSEILSNVQGLREDLKNKDQTAAGLAFLLKGSEAQNQKQREVTVHEPR